MLTLQPYTIPPRRKTTVMFKITMTLVAIDFFLLAGFYLARAL